MHHEAYQSGNTNNPELSPDIDDEYSAMARFWTDKLLYEKISRENQDITKIMVATFNPQIVRNYDKSTIAKFEHFYLLLANELRTNDIKVIDSSSKISSKIFLSTSKQADLSLNFIQGWLMSDHLKSKTWVDDNTVMAQTNPKNEPIQIWPLIVPETF